jgi:hypothetical protein
MKTFVRGLVSAVLVAGLAAASATDSVAASAPTAVTGSASQVTASAAVVSGTVNPNGQATTYAFQYGPTTNYGSQTATTSAGSGTTAAAVHVTLNGLISNGTYHFRIVATSPAGTTAGTDATFTTSKAPPAATTSAPSLLTSNSAVVNGTVNPNGKTTTYIVEYGPTTSYGLQTTTSAAGSGTAPVAVHATLNGLAGGTSYHYRIAATNDDGTTVTADAMFTTTGNRVNPTGPLPAVSGAAAVAITAHSVQLNGSINPQGPNTRWYFEFGLTAYYGLQTSPQTLSGSGAQPVNVSISGLQSGTAYHYRLVAYSSSGLYVGPDYIFKTKQTARVSAPLVLSATAHLSRGVVTIPLHGRVRLPAGVPSNAACHGSLALQFSQGSASVGLRHTQLRADCTYSLTVHITSRAIHNKRALSVVCYFWGNAELLPTSHRASLHF